MARLYFLTSADSDLTGGSDFNKKLLPNIISAASGLTVATAGNVTETSYVFTEPPDPGSRGSVTGDFTISVDITTSGTNMSMTFAVARINSAGTQQSISSASSSISLTTTGVKTATLTGVNLGTFASTDRLRLHINHINGGAGSRSFGLNLNSANSYLLTPFIVKFFATT